MAEIDRQFNLLDEPWILVRRNGCETSEVSLTDALIHAHEYDALSGELPTQDIAILRLLLAVLHTVFSRVDANGDEITIDTDNAVEVWSELWENGRFPENPIHDYLERWHERFWLFHPERPFFQVKSKKKGTEYTSAKLNGELSESGNKIRLFPKRAGRSKNELTFPEAARWLLYLNGYDDTSSKPKEKGLPSPGAGWLGKLGLIWAAGANLFETLMLNLVLLRDAAESWGENLPIWELESARTGERTEIPQPDNPAALYTLQSRRISLIRDGNRVLGYSLLGGDFFDKSGAFCEQQTIWRPIYDKKNITGYQPQRHDSSKQLWREFSAVAEKGVECHQPGVVSWIAYLRERGALEEEFFCSFEIASVQYGDKDFFVNDIFSDSLTFNIGILTDAGIDCRILIENEISRCDRLADIIADFAGDLMRAAGGDPTSLRAFAKEQYYYRIDREFRKWITSVSPSQTPVEREDRREEWRKINLDIIRELGRELAASQGPAAFIGRSIEIDKGKTKMKLHYSVPEAQNLFIRRINNVDRQ